jgi:hypothetical protein
MPIRQEVSARVISTRGVATAVRIAGQLFHQVASAARKKRDQTIRCATISSAPTSPIALK